MLTRRNFLISSSLGLLGSALYARLLEPGWLDLTHHRVPFFKDPGSSLRILHLSDLHYSDVVPLPVIQSAIQLGLEQKPDLVCLTGDYMTAPLPGYEAYVETLKVLSAQCPVFACLGNHDYQRPGRTSVPPEVKNKLVMPALLKASGIQLLNNQMQVLQLEGRSLQVAGLGDFWAGKCLPEKAFATGKSNLPTLLLSHNPDSKSRVGSYPWNLMLCGHSHGGQLKIPFYGAIHAPIEDFGYIEGLNAWKDRLIYTTRGVGNLHGIRFNCRPEVSVLELMSF